MNVFTQVWKWVVENITPLLTVTNITILITTIASIIKRFKTERGAIIENTGATSELKAEMAASKEASMHLVNGINEIKQENAELKNTIVEMAKANEALLSRLDSILDIQHIVYNAQPLTEDVRSAVNAIIVNSKYTATAAREAVGQAIIEAEEIIDNAIAIAKEPLRKAKRIVQEDKQVPSAVQF